ncbi:hypothetical protein QJS83_13540 [Bdellovibrio sp. 22V]|uniref:hypothetical protein n=1 Tax=Bdellovibrio TaxID=958 RepID=UPI002543F1DA|nr:hypothetical protein [Bdellovibrio sp. 22V]WII71487.1 hypothetical protein QJS83_13540 [Bdellovibrio sp. 22V]
MRWLIVLSLVLCSCTEGDPQKLGETQFCLDNAGRDEAHACLAEISDIHTPYSYVLRCSAGFISEDFGRGDKFRRSFQQLDDPSQGMAALLAIFTFGSKPTPEDNREYAKDTNEDCFRSKQRSLRLFGALSVIATTIAQAGGLTWDRDNPPTAADMKTAIAAMKASVDPANLEAIKEIGENVLAISQNSCRVKGNVPNEKLCNHFRSAEGDPAVVAVNFLTQWETGAF